MLLFNIRIRTAKGSLRFCHCCFLFGIPPGFWPGLLTLIFLLKFSLSRFPAPIFSLQFPIFMLKISCFGFLPGSSGFPYAYVWLIFVLISNYVVTDRALFVWGPCDRSHSNNIFASLKDQTKKVQPVLYYNHASVNFSGTDF